MVAASLSATEDPTDEGEGTANAEEVDNPPSTVEAVTRPVVCRADISDIDDSPATSAGDQQLAKVKEESQLEEPATGEPAFSAEVAGDNAATDEVAEITTLLANSGLEGANNNLEQSELEGQQLLGPSYTEAVREVADQLIAKCHTT